MGGSAAGEPNTSFSAEHSGSDDEDDEICVDDDRMEVDDVITLRERLAESSRGEKL